VLAVPYLAGGLGGLLLVRTVMAAPAALALDAAPMWGLASGVVSGCVLGVLAAVSGGPLGDGRLTAVGPSAWQVGLVSALELGISAAVTAGVVNFRALRRAGALPAAAEPAPDRANAAVTVGADGRHVIFVDPWAGDPPSEPTPRGPSALP
jgi:hypothetical protein